MFDGSFGYELEWEGRQLKKYQKYEDDLDGFIYRDTITFTYNADGIRTSKTVAGVKHEYHLNGSQIVFETWIEGNVEHFILYLYDEAGSPIGLSYRNSSLASGVYHTCFFEKNLQGDVVAIYNSSGTTIGTYTYDAWGECTYKQSAAATTLERNIARYYNPFRYRGYFYDIETELYYLQTRYYNPSWCRFISPDNSSVILATPDQLTDKNLYAYCYNNPVMRVDADGEFWLTALAVGFAVGFIVSAAVSAVNQIAFEGEVDLVDVLIDATIGGVTGAVAAVMPSAAFGVNIALNSLASAGESVYMDIKENREVIKEGRSQKELTSTGNIISNAIVSGGMSALFTYVGGPYSSTYSRNFSKFIVEVGKELFESAISGFGEWASGSLTSGYIKSVMEW